MRPVDAVRQALLELGDVSAEQLAAHVEQRHGLRTEPRYIPLFLATIKDRDRLLRLRQAGR